MLKVLKNLKESFWKVVIIIILLCVQAWADLLLPDYTSKIVNTGIQAGGIESPIPDVISKTNMDNLLLFTDDDEFILENYNLIGSKTNNHEDKIINKYFGKNYKVKESDIYVLKDIDENQKQELSDKISTPLMEMTTISNEQTAIKIKEQITRKSSRKSKTIYDGARLS